MTAREVWDEAVRRLMTKDMNGFADLWAVDGVMEFPFAAPGYPRPTSREQVREYLKDYPDKVDLRRVVSQVVHECVDPGVLIVEWEVEGTVVASGTPYRMRYVAVITTKDGEIVSYRDYWSPSAAGEALGDPELSSFTGKANQ